MNPPVITLDTAIEDHEQFLKEGHVDPYTQRAFKEQDHVIITSAKEVWLHQSWTEAGENTDNFLTEIPTLKGIQFKPSISNFVASPERVQKGQLFKLSWITSFSDKVHISDLGYFEEKIGEVSVTAGVTKTYTLSAYNKKGTKTRQCVVRIVSPKIHSNIRRLNFGRIRAELTPVQKLIDINNKGDLELNWYISEVPDWINVEKLVDGNSLSVSAKPEFIGRMQGVITIISNGGDLNIPVQAHIIPTAIKSFSVKREGYRAKVEWSLNLPCKVSINGKNVTDENSYFVPYLHKSRIHLTAVDQENNLTERYHQIQVPIEKLVGSLSVTRVLKLQPLIQLHNIREALNKHLSLLAIKEFLLKLVSLNRMSEFLQRSIVLRNIRLKMKKNTSFLDKNLQILIKITAIKPENKNA